MPAVRYVALVALVVWLGVTLVVLGGQLFEGIEQQFHLIAAAAAGTVLVSLFVMKFVGPPPRAFALRAGLATAMLGVAAYSLLTGRWPVIVLGGAVVLGLVLLSWYSNE